MYATKVRAFSQKYEIYESFCACTGDLILLIHDVVFDHLDWWERPTTCTLQLWFICQILYSFPTKKAIGASSKHCYDRTYNQSTVTLGNHPKTNVMQTCWREINDWWRTVLRREADAWIEFWRGILNLNIVWSILTRRVLISFFLLLAPCSILNKFPARKSSQSSRTWNVLPSVHFCFISQRK